MSLRIVGLEDVRRILTATMPAEADKLTREVAADLARDIANDAKRRMPSDSGKMIAGTKGQKESAKAGMMASVRVGGGAYYWRFLEYGQGPDGVEYAFFLKAKEFTMGDFQGRVAASFKRRLAAAMRRGL